MMKALIYQTIIFLVCVLLITGCSAPSDSFESKWLSRPNLVRSWAGPEYWLNPLQAWQQAQGKMTVIAPGGDRNIALLTHDLGEGKGDFEIEFSFEDFQTADEHQELNKGLNANGWIGLQLGLKGQFDDYRDDVVHGRGLSLGYNQSGYLFIGTEKSNDAYDFLSNGIIKVSGHSNSDTTFQVEVSLYKLNEKIGSFRKEIHNSWLTGSLALTASQSAPDTLNLLDPRPHFSSIPELNKGGGGNNTVSFSSWKVNGEKVRHYDRSYGPILWAQYTLSDNILKMSVQMAPVGNDDRLVDLFIDGQKIASEVIDEIGRNVLFKVENWQSDQDHRYDIQYKNKADESFSYTGIIKADYPDDKLKIATLSCVDDRGFPHQDIVDNVAAHNPEMLVFHGDQLYERVGGYGVERNSILDYQRKWYIFGWSFGPLIKDRPTVIIPDDHDVFHGNLWGEGGKAADLSQGYGNFGQDSGGYKESPEFVNMVHRTQTGHLPDPSDPSPVAQGISVYFTNMNYGGVSFAILGDRQWKTAPKQFFPNAEIENGWPQNIQWDPKTEAYHPQAELLGPRQEMFLNEWVENWSQTTKFKSVISQSPFCNVATLPADIWHDKYVPGLRRYKIGEYPEDDRPVADFDSNGWPQNKRDLVLKTMRKAGALHLTGDQHLGSTGQYGIETYGDAGFWLSTPAVSNLWPRRWFPAEEAKSGKDEKDGRRYSGDYEDGFGNKITVMGIANPYDIDREPSMVYDKAPGYSIVEYDMNSGNIDLAVWPRWSSPALKAPDNQPFPDWPITITSSSGYRQAPIFSLGEISVNEGDLIKIFREDNGELILVKRIFEARFRPQVYDLKTKYRVLINDVEYRNVVASPL